MAILFYDKNTPLCAFSSWTKDKTKYVKETTDRQFVEKKRRTKQ